MVDVEMSDMKCSSQPQPPARMAGISQPTDPPRTAHLYFPRAAIESSPGTLIKYSLICRVGLNLCLTHLAAAKTQIRAAHHHSTTQTQTLGHTNTHPLLPHLTVKEEMPSLAALAEALSAAEGGAVSTAVLFPLEVCSYMYVLDRSG